MTMQPQSGFSLGPGHLPPPEKLRAKWGWFMGLGIAAVAAGLIALAITEFATIASVLTIGIFVVLVGVTEIVLGFRARGWGRAIYWELSGLLYVVAGMFAWAEPAEASLVITLLLGAGLLATGVVRAAMGFRLHGSRLRGPLILSGIVTALLGLIVVTGWPGNSLFVIGLLLGIELVFSGVNWIFFGLRLRSHT